MQSDFNKNSTMDTAQILACISGGLIAIGFFLPWIQIFFGGMFYKSLPAKGNQAHPAGCGCLKESR